MRKDCNAKKFYDTEFEAQVAASKSEATFGVPMVEYLCGNHWHVGNVLPEYRSKNRVERPGYCALCDIYVSVKKYQKHINGRPHKKREKEKETA